MPSKSRKLQQSTSTNARSVGFLRPTMASQRRSVSVKLENPTRSAPVHKKRANKSTRSKQYDDAGRHSPERNIKSAVELYNSSTSESSIRSMERNCVSVPAALPVSDRSALEDAKKMCADLQKQINELKVNQENLNRSWMKSDNYDSMHSKQTSVNSLDKVVDTPLLATDLHQPAKSLHPNSVIRVNVQRNSRPLFDASNLEHELPNVQAYNSTFRKRDTPESVIKRLHSERDKYKHKVIKLQTELKLVKHGKNKIMKSPEISSRDIMYYNTNMIGEGHIATVYSGTYNGKQVAVKKISKLGMLTSSDYSYLSAEAGLLVHLQHRNIVKIFGVCLSPMEPLIVMEMVQGNTLLSLLDSSGGRLTPGQYFSISRDVAIGLAYLHNQRPPVLHLNLRPCNVLIDAFHRAKVADFGFSKLRISAGLSHHNALAYLAPELIKYPVQLTGKIDVYAFAVLLWQCHTCSDPANGFSTSEILDMLQTNDRLPLGPELPQAFHKLISKCWATSPIQRPTFKEIILELETMILPEEWNENLRLMGVARMDTSDLSSSHDTTSLSSQMTDSNKHFHATSGTNARSDPKQVSTTIPVHNSSHAPQTVHSQKLTTEADEKLKPTPCNDVKYVSKILEQINHPEIVNESVKSAAMKDVDQLRPHVSYLSRYTHQKEATRPYISPIKYSKFDDKFHDYVSRACEAESESKANVRRPYEYGKNRQRAPSYSSDPIRVYSLSTPSESTDKSSGSVTTAVYKPPLLRSDRGAWFGKSSDDLLRREFRRSNEVLSNAKRLLLNSPLSKHQSGVRDYGAASNDYRVPARYATKSTSEPSRYRRNYDYADPLKLNRNETGALQSPRSDEVSTDSFVPLPPKLGSQSRIPTHERGLANEGNSKPSLVFESSSVSPNASESQSDHCDIFPCKGNYRDEPAPNNDNKDGRIEKVLRSAADQLSDVSNVLHSAADEKRFTATEIN